MPASKTATFLLALSGIPVVREGGNIIMLPSARLEVAEEQGRRRNHQQQHGQRKRDRGQVLPSGKKDHDAGDHKQN
jgi:hypothetical protein